MPLLGRLEQRSAGHGDCVAVSRASNERYLRVFAIQALSCFSNNLVARQFHLRQSFDSNVEKDMNGQFGKPIKEMLGKTYDMIIDPGGKVLMVQPEKHDKIQLDERLAIITNMLKDMLDVVNPPQKGKAGERVA